MGTGADRADGADDGNGPRPWWREAVVYQVYPRSFQDTDGDGVGDLAGVRERVDHIAELGADAVWLCPFYDSPMADNGYDVRDHRAVDDRFGTMAEFEGLLADLHERGIAVLVDAVFNHTSVEHEWFQRSRDPDSEYRDWYYWREGDPDEPPNNWEAFFGGPAWTYDERAEAWYLHLFSPSQPDLNWRTPAVRDACIDVLEFWLEKGVDGFRFDVLNLLSKVEGLPDGGPDPIQVGGEHFLDGPRIHEYVGEIHERAFAGRGGADGPDGSAGGPHEPFTVAELGGADPSTAAEYLEGGDGLCAAFAFDHLRVDHGEGRFDVRSAAPDAVADALARWQTAEAWPALPLGNHDEPRPVSRFGDGTPAAAVALATVLLTLRGTPFIHQGEELGARNHAWPDPDAFVDVDSRAVLEGRAGTGLGPDERLAAVRARSRDNARTPMRWTDDHAGGFTDGEPWLPVAPCRPAAAQRGDPDSVLAAYRRLIRLRGEHSVLVDGRFERVDAPPGVFAYARGRGDRRLFVAANLGPDRRRFEVPAAGERLFGAGGDGTPLAPWQAVVRRWPRTGTEG
jgi:glycosidase